jgi:hypothetical protein
VKAPQRKKENDMISLSVRSILCAIVFSVICVSGADAQSERGVRRGIGLVKCAKILSDLDLSEGLKGRANLAMVSWFQGYVSAANVAMLESGGKNVALSDLDETKIVSMIVSFCKANAEKRPVDLIDTFIRDIDKSSTKWESGTVKWNK